VPLVTVAGTNGKGSTVAMLAAIWQAAGWRVGTSTSPHLVHFNERIRIDGEPLPPAHILAAIERIEPFIAPDTLTYFEIATLAAMACFVGGGGEGGVEASVDAIVLEVGLGGRLDAANLWDADLAILTSVALDHADWLGTDLEVIATEKAAIARPGRALIVGEWPAPASLPPFAEANGIELVPAEPAAVPESLSLDGEHQRRNAACAVAAAMRLSTRLPVSASDLQRGLSRTRVDARMQRLRHHDIDVCLDVAHNPHAARALAAALAAALGAKASAGAHPSSLPGWHLVFAALGDKDIEGIVQALAPIARSFACPTLDSDRAMAGEALAERVRQALGRSGGPVSACASVADASALAFSRAEREGGGVLVAGSFVTVGDWLGTHPTSAA